MQQSGILDLLDAGTLTVAVGMSIAGCLPLGTGKASDRRFFNAFILANTLLSENFF
jgi:hypothetical protein